MLPRIVFTLVFLLSHNADEPDQALKGVLDHGIYYMNMHHSDPNQYVYSLYHNDILVSAGMVNEHEVPKCSTVCIYRYPVSLSLWIARALSLSLYLWFNACFSICSSACFSLFLSTYPQLTINLLFFIMFFLSFI